MPNVVNPRPRIMDERWYHKLLKDRILSPLQSRVFARIAEAQLAKEWMRGVTEEFYKFIDDPNLGEAEAAEAVARFNNYQRAEFVKKMSRAFGVNVSPLMPDSVIAHILRERLSENVRLIKSIPEQLLGQVDDHFARVFSEQGFDRGALRKMLEERFGVANSRAKLISRDQVNKAIGELNAARNKQLGIEYYRWQTAGDERVRPDHAALNGTRQRWDTPPGVGHPGFDIQCRCIAISQV